MATPKSGLYIEKEIIVKGEFFLYFVAAAIVIALLIVSPVEFSWLLITAWFAWVGGVVVGRWWMRYKVRKGLAA